jgi:hypothetical protein
MMMMKKMMMLPHRNTVRSNQVVIKTNTQHIFDQGHRFIARNFCLSFAAESQSVLSVRQRSPRPEPTWSHYLVRDRFIRTAGTISIWNGVSEQDRRFDLYQTAAG